ncbi:MAG TPA: roadblock/LC7 domain-containing protein [Polyangiaceae bacterium]|nr:roadblock/LC7 domain-containing protein [Polyangiaceae bacterium]
MITQILAGMRDVDGVHGSFVVSKTGVLAGKDLPPMFDDAVLGEVGRRIVRLHEGLCAEGDDFDQCVMRFADHKLYLRSVPNGFLCVLSTNGVNIPALKMALTLTSRRVDPLIMDATAAAPTSTAHPSAGQRNSEAPPNSGAPSRRQATYRGHRV